ncbi:MAG: hypothetical protein JWM46_437 [Candidatus Kaiserbacteria bacterium]|nr:hypothetical protein [Candidatus Kaiserbacteria bacterium]
MATIKSNRIVSKDDAMDAAIRRAASVLKGSSIPLNRHTIAVQASRYVTQGVVSIKNRIDAMTYEQHEALGLNTKRPGSRGRDTAPIRIGRWNR